MFFAAVRIKCGLSSTSTIVVLTLGDQLLWLTSLPSLPSSCVASTLERKRKYLNKLLACRWHIAEIPTIASSSWTWSNTWNIQLRDLQSTATLFFELPKRRWALQCTHRWDHLSWKVWWRTPHDLSLPLVSPTIIVMRCLDYFHSWKYIVIFPEVHPQLVTE